MRNQDDFVKALKKSLCEGAGRKLLEAASNPVGRGIPPEKRELASWIKGLSNEDQTYVQHLVDKGIDATLFSTLCILDGVRAIEAAGTKGRLKLSYIGTDGQEIELNPSNGEFLHDVYKSLD